MQPSPAGSSDQQAEPRKPATLAKVARMRQALAHQEPDRVPISDFFWGGFVRRWREELGLPADADPYYHYDPDWIVTTPNMDPWIRPFATIEEDDQEVVVKTGFGAVMRKKFDFPMPESVGWETDTIEKLEAAQFDALADPRRFFAAGDTDTGWESAATATFRSGRPATPRKSAARCSASATRPRAAE